MDYQWYPGHMTAAVRMMQENRKLIDLLIELVDARIPMSSRNPDIDKLGSGKTRIILLNKADLADPSRSAEWIAHFQDQGMYAMEISSKSSTDVRRVQGLVREACRERLERNRRRGIVDRPMRAMVAGIPNVGKSTFINTLAGKAVAKTGNKPGVTRGKQWIRLNPQLELLDTPGILWPKFEDQEVGKRLAFIGAIKDELLQTEELACELLLVLMERYPGFLKERYGEVVPQRTDMPEEGNDLTFAFRCLEQIARSRMCFGKGEVLDTERAAAILIDDFRSGRLGRITLEDPGQDS